MPDAPQRRHPVGFAGHLLTRRGINRLRFAATEELLGAGAELVDETGRGSVSAERMLLTAQATRALHTFEAVIAVSRIGRGAQAAMLNRSLYDDALDIHWVAANPDLGPERADEHDRLIALAEHKLETDFGRTDTPLTDAESAELDRLIQLYGGPRSAFGAAWHRASYDQCFGLVKARWKDDAEAGRYLDYLYEVTQRRNNLMLHPSPTAFRQTIVTRADGSRQLNRIGADGYWKQALNDGCGGFYLCMKVLAEEFEFELEPIAEVFSRATTLMKRVEEDSRLGELDQHAPCPCGLGATVAECHGS